MRVLVVHPGPAWATADVYHGWCNGLDAAGCDVRPFNLDSRLDVYSTACRADGTPIWPDGHEQVALVAHDLHGATFQFAPDWVLVIAPKLLPVWCYDTLRARRVRVAMLHTESPYLDVEQLVNAEHADLNLINTRQTSTGSAKSDPSRMCRTPTTLPGTVRAHRNGMPISHGWGPPGRRSRREPGSSSRSAGRQSSLFSPGYGTASPKHHRYTGS